VAVSL